MVRNYVRRLIIPNVGLESKAVVVNLLLGEIGGAAFSKFIPEFESPGHIGLIGGEEAVSVVGDGDFECRSGWSRWE